MSGIFIARRCRLGNRGQQESDGVEAAIVWQESGILSQRSQHIADDLSLVAISGGREQLLALGVNQTQQFRIARRLLAQIEARAQVQEPLQLAQTTHRRHTTTTTITTTTNRSDTEIDSQSLSVCLKDHYIYIYQEQPRQFRYLF